MSSTLIDLHRLDGLITPEVGEWLYHAARAVPDHLAIVELGSYKGASTAYLAAGSRDGNGAQVYAVDAWAPDVTAPRWSPVATKAEFETQLRSVGLRGYVVAIQARTADAALTYDGPPVGLLFVDADHSEPGVLADVRRWRRHLAGDALVVLDDYRTPKNPGVERALAQLLTEGTLRRLVEVAGGRLAVCE